MSNTILTGEAVADILAAMQKAGLNGWEMLVPEGVEEITPGAFAGMKNLRRAAQNAAENRCSCVLWLRRSGSNRIARRAGGTRHSGIQK